MVTWLNASFEMRSRLIGGLTVRFAESARYLRSYPAEPPVLAGLLPQVDTPMQVIAGACDTAVPPVNASFPHQRLAGPGDLCTCGS